MNFTDLLISSTLALIMFGIGLSLKISHFQDTFSKPKALITGLTAQMILLPALAFSLGCFFQVSNEVKVGLLILAVCPGGTTSNFIVYLLKGNTALSVALTTINSFLTLISIPFIVNMGLRFFMGESTQIHLPFFQTVGQIFSITIIPIFMGILVAKKLPSVAKILNKNICVKLWGKKYSLGLIKLLTIVLLGVVFLIKIFADKNAGGAQLTQNDWKTMLPMALLFNFSGLLLGFLTAKILQLPRKNIMTIAIEVGLQNTTLAFLIAGTLLENTTMQKPALIYAFFSFWTALFFGGGIKRFCSA